MVISTKGRYALRIMISLAEHHTGDFIALKIVADEEHLSRKYLEAIASILSKAGLIEGRHGKKGGYRLLRKPTEYTLGEIVKPTEHVFGRGACTPADEASRTCPAGGKALVVWEKFDQVVDEFLESITLAEIMKGKVKVS